jgi:hypothetical protein
MIPTIVLIVLIIFAIPRIEYHYSITFRSNPDKPKPGAGSALAIPAAKAMGAGR